MSIHTDTIAEQAGLGEAESQYLSQVGRRLPDLPASIRAALLTEAAELLGERPAARDLAALVEAFGEPASLAQSLRNSIADPGSATAQRSAMSSPRGRVVRLGAGLAVAVCVLLAYRWYVAVPGIGNPCGGVEAAGVTTLSAAGATEYRAPFIEGGRIGLYVCFAPDDPEVVIEAVRVDAPVPLRPVGAELDVTPALETLSGNASTFEPYRPVDYPWGATVIVWLEMEHCASGSGPVGVEGIDLTYRYRGRSRTMEFPLGYRASVAFDGSCADDSDLARDRENEQWVQVVGRVTGLERTHEPLGLSSIDVSRDLCRALAGPVAPSSMFDGIEPVSSRAVFTIEDADLARALIDGAVLGICPEFADRRDALIAMAG